MRVAGEIDGDPVDGEREVGAVIEVEPAQEVLVRLAVARVLGDDHAGNGFFEQLPTAEQRQIREVSLADGALRGALGRPQELLGAPVYHDLGHLGRRRRCPGRNQRDGLGRRELLRPHRCLPAGDQPHRHDGETVARTHGKVAPHNTTI